MALPAFPVWTADPGWQRIDLLSDVHLCADMPRTFEAWRQHLLTTPADAVLMLGDLFEVWVGDDARTAGFEAECTAVLREAARHRVLAFMPGNRDFLVGTDLLNDTGVRALPDPCVLQAWEQRLLLTHGDALCLDDRAYQQFRAEVRSADWQQAFLARPLAERQVMARAMRDASMRHQAAQPATEWADVDAAACAAWAAAAGTSVLVHGHTHRPATHDLAGGGQRWVLGDWDLERPPGRASALKLTRQGLSRFDIAAA